MRLRRKPVSNCHEGATIFDCPLCLRLGADTPVLRYGRIVLDDLLEHGYGLYNAPLCDFPACEKYADWQGVHAMHIRAQEATK